MTHRPVKPHCQAEISIYKNAPTVAESVHFAYDLINKQDLFLDINYIDSIPI